MHPIELSKAKRTRKYQLPVKTSDDILTMNNCRSYLSVPKSVSVYSRAKDDIRLLRNASSLRKRRLRRENIALRRQICQMENLIEVRGNY